MKLYKMILRDKREEFVPADSYSEVDDRFIFFRDGTAQIGRGRLRRLTKTLLLMWKRIEKKSNPSCRVSSLVSECGR